MSDLSAKFAALESQLAAQAEASDALVDTVEAKLQSIFDTLDTILVNNAANTKALLSALGQTAACFPCPTPSMTVPPITTTPTAVNAASCQRTQGIIATLHNILAQMDTMQSFNVVGTFNVVNDAISEIIGAIVAGDTVPLPTFPEVVNIVGNYISYAGERAFSGIGLVDQFSPLEGALIQATWLSEDPDTANAQYAEVIDASEASLVAKYLFKAIAYTALWNYYYDPETMPDVSGYDGTTCAVVTCEVLPSAVTHINGGEAINIIEWTPIWLPVDNHDGTTSDKMSWSTRDLFGYTITPTVQVKLFVSAEDTGSILFGDSPYTVSVHTTFAAIVQNGSSGAFTAEVCPPE
jgi:hypothetical protein